MKCLGAFIVVTFLVICQGNSGNSAKILALFYLNGKSHFVMFEALLKGLAAKGHQVHVVGHFPQKNPIANYTDISVHGSLPTIVNNFTVDFVRNLHMKDLVQWILFETYKMCEITIEHPEVQKLINSREKYDVIISEIFGVDCFMGFGHYFNAPMISGVSSVMFPWGNDRIANPDNPSFIPNYFLPYTPQMSFWERLTNLLSTEALKLVHYYFSERPMDKLTRKHLGQDIPPISELKKNTSLIFVNSHLSINQPRPAVPGFIEVGGLHIQDEGTLPKDLEMFLNEGKQGVIYLCLGSLIRSDTLPKEKINAFVDAFKELPYKVLWKTDPIEGLPKDIKTVKWAPQLQILKHPHVRVFITHGGLMGTQEGVYTGVPMVGIPMFADQELNIRNIMSRGAAVLLHYDSLTKESLLQALDTVLNNPSYRKNAKHLSQIFRDRPRTALETAIYWTEYVIRHKGASHLKSAAVDLPWYQYLLLDVLAVLSIAVVFVVVCLYIIIKKIVKIIMPSSRTAKKQKVN